MSVDEKSLNNPLAEMLDSDAFDIIIVSDGSTAMKEKMRELTEDGIFRRE